MFRYQHTPLPHDLHPKTVVMDLEYDGLFDAAEEELSVAATFNPDKLWGYFPALAGQEGIDTKLTGTSQRIEAAMPTLEIEEHQLVFNFLRLSLTAQPKIADFHLDSDAATALTGDTDNLFNRRVWRLLINASSRFPRELAYADVDARTVPLSLKGNYVYTEAPIVERSRSLVLPRRRGDLVHAALFCSNLVFHGPRDNGYGHFVAAYGGEESV